MISLEQIRDWTDRIERAARSLPIDDEDKETIDLVVAEMGRAIVDADLAALRETSVTGDGVTPTKGSSPSPRRRSRRPKLEDGDGVDGPFNKAIVKP